MPRRITEPMPFKQARHWARSLGLRTNKEWRKYPLSNFPAGIPKNPESFYGSEWTTWGDWLGTGRLAERRKEFRSYSASRKWVRGNGIRTDKQLRDAFIAGRVPADIPRTPRYVYRTEWTSSGEFYGTDYVAGQFRKYRTLRQTKRWAVENHIFNAEDWREASKAGRMPKDIPSAPRKVYGDAFTGWPAFFGNSVRGGSSFTESVIARELGQFVAVDQSARTIRLTPRQVKRVDIVLPKTRVVLEYDGAHWHEGTVIKDRAEVHLFSRAGWRLIRIRESPLDKLSEDDLVVSPRRSLHQRICAILNHLVDLSIIPKTKKVAIERYCKNGLLIASKHDLAHVAGWLSFKQARRWARAQNLSSSTHFRRLVREHGLPRNIPSAPEMVYQSEWTNWGDFLGTKNPFYGPRDWRSFEDARAWVKLSRIRTYKSWNAAVRSEKIPLDIPRRPASVYPEWISYPHWFGLDLKGGQRREWRSYEAARDWVRASGATCDREWRLLVKTGKVPSDIPTNPARVYLTEWAGLGDWFGTGNVSPRKRAFRSFEPAREFARSLGLRSETEWRSFKSSDRRPRDIPSAPDAVYAASGWKGWPDWLGTSK